MLRCGGRSRALTCRGPNGAPRTPRRRRGNRRRSHRELTFHPIVPPSLEPRVIHTASGVFSVWIGTFNNRRKHLGDVPVSLGDVATFAATDDDGRDASHGALGA